MDVEGGEIAVKILCEIRSIFRPSNVYIGKGEWPNRKGPFPFNPRGKTLKRYRASLTGSNGSSPKEWRFMLKSKIKEKTKIILAILILCVLSYALNHQWEEHIIAEIRRPLRQAAQFLRDQILEYLVLELWHRLLKKANKYWCRQMN